MIQVNTTTIIDMIAFRVSKEIFKVEITFKVNTKDNVTLI